MLREIHARIVGERRPDSRILEGNEPDDDRISGNADSNFSSRRRDSSPPTGFIGMLDDVVRPIDAPASVRKSWVGPLGAVARIGSQAGTDEGVRCSLAAQATTRCERMSWPPTGRKPTAAARMRKARILSLD